MPTFLFSKSDEMNQGVVAGGGDIGAGLEVEAGVEVGGGVTSLGGTVEQVMLGGLGTGGGDIRVLLEVPAGIDHAGILKDFQKLFPPALVLFQLAGGDLQVFQERIPGRCFRRGGISGY